MIQVAQQVIGLANHSKLGKVAFAWVAPASSIDVLVPTIGPIAVHSRDSGGG
jgi:DeoR/GlpR family transcriptional regulator of sugar metabolism